MPSWSNVTIQVPWWNLAIVFARVRCIDRSNARARDARSRVQPAEALRYAKAVRQLLWLQALGTTHSAHSGSSPPALIHTPRGSESRPYNTKTARVSCTTKSRERDSNPRPTVYKTVALPAELSRRQPECTGFTLQFSLRRGLRQDLARVEVRGTLRLTRWSALSTVFGSQPSSSPISSYERPSR